MIWYQQQQYIYIIYIYILLIYIYIYTNASWIERGLVCCVIGSWDLGLSSFIVEETAYPLGQYMKRIWWDKSEVQLETSESCVSLGVSKEWRVSSCHVITVATTHFQKSWTKTGINQRGIKKESMTLKKMFLIYI